MGVKQNRLTQKVYTTYRFINTLINKNKYNRR